MNFYNTIRPNPNQWSLNIISQSKFVYLLILQLAIPEPSRAPTDLRDFVHAWESPSPSVRLGRSGWWVISIHDIACNKFWSFGSVEQAPNYNAESPPPWP